MGILLYEMCTLKPPFDANSLQQLALKIVNGKQTPIPSHYSKEMKNLVTAMLSRDPAKRPRVHDILQMPIIKDRIKDFLTKTQQCVEFNHTVIHNKDLNLIQNEEQKSSSHDQEDEEKFKQDSQHSKREEEEMIREAERQKAEERRKEEERRRREELKKREDDERRRREDERKREELA